MIENKNTTREKFYKPDYTGFAYYNISRLYNDLFINTQMFDSIYKGNKDTENSQLSNMLMYLFKNLVSNLKEGLKLLGTIKRSPYYKELYDNWNTNEEVRKLFEELNDETLKPEEYPDTVNAKYLSFRNDVFHYCVQPKDFELYKKINKTLIDENIDVGICLYDNKYHYEIGVDMPLAHDIFNETALQEVTVLKEKIMKLLNLILTEYINKL